ncbi:MAG: T9SS type A sorting domain-containing protein [Chloroflexota bacterium]
MRRFYIVLAVILLTALSANAQVNDKPLRQPAFLGGIDSASKNFIRQENANRHKSKAYENQDRLQGTLIEDPRVIFSTYLGGNGYDCGNSLSVTQDSGVYVVGYTGSTNFPVSDDAVQKEKKGGHDMFVGKFSKTGERVWLTYLGGNGTDVATECVTDKDDNLILFGKTNSIDFPTSGGTEQDSSAGNIDVVIVKFDPTGKIIWSRYYGGSSGEIGDGIALCANKRDFVITGSTLSRKDGSGNRPLPVTSGCYQDSLAQGPSYWQTPLPDAFVSKFTGDGKLVWGTYFGGKQNDAAHAVAVDKDDNIAIVGETKTQLPPEPPAFPVTPDAFKKDTCQKEDIFFAKFDKNGTLKYSTIICGETGNPDDDTHYAYDLAGDVKFDSKGNTVILGQTDSKLFPTTPNAYKEKYDSYDAVLLKFSPNNEVIWSTYYGGSSGGEYGASLAMTDNDTFWISGLTTSPDLIVSEDAFFKPHTDIGGIAQNLTAKFNEKGYPMWSTIYWGGFCYKIDIITENNFYITGEQMGSPTFPVTKDAFQYYDSDGPYDSYLVHFNILMPSDTTDTLDTNKIIPLIIYPNPVNDILYLQIPENYNIESFSIYDILGRKIIETYEGKNQKILPINVSYLSPGWYGLVIKQELKEERVMFLKQ